MYFSFNNDVSQYGLVLVKIYLKLNVFNMRTFHKILISTDFSPIAWRAVQMGLDFTKSEHVEVSLLHVYPSKNKKVGEMERAEDKDALSNLDKEIRQLCQELELSFNTPISPVLLSGDVNDEILHYIKDNPHDLVIVGINSNGFDNEAGSHTAAIIKSANIPVLVMPNLPVSV